MVSVLYSVVTMLVAINDDANNNLLGSHFRDDGSYQALSFIEEGS